jgi:ankyrin repeat protein
MSLYDAVGSGDITAVRVALAKPDVASVLNQRHPDYAHTPLTKAISRGFANIVNELVHTSGVNVNLDIFEEEYRHVVIRKTPLFLACASGNIEIVKALLGVEGIDVNAATNYGVTPLMIACENGRIEIVRALLDIEGINVNAATNHGETSLSLACENRRIEIVRVLLGVEGINVNAAQNNGVTPLMVACRNNSIEIVQALLNKEGINVNAAQNNGVTALRLAIEKNEIDIVRELIKIPEINVMQVGIRAFRGEFSDEINKLLRYAYLPSLYEAVNMENIAAVRSELAKPNSALTINNPGEDKQTPLILAIIKNNSEIVDELLRAPGINVNAPSGHGYTPLVKACDYSRIDIIGILLDWPGVDVEQARELARRRRFTERVNNILVPPDAQYVPGPETLLPWEGYSKVTIQTFDILLDTDAPVGERSPADNFSACPICLDFVERKEACMIMKHDCSKKVDGLYHRRLYDMYKNDRGEISWCTLCGRICSGHKHYTISNSAVMPTVLSTVITRDLVYGSDAECKALGGGGLAEKLARVRRMREYALELNGQIGRITKMEAHNRLVEETWDAPMQDYGSRVAKIRTDKAWNIPSNSFNAVVATPVAPRATTVYPNAGNPERLPVIHPRGPDASNFNDEVDNAIQFRHSRPSGIVNNHARNYISIDNLFRRILNQRIPDERGLCWNFPYCKAHIFPEELEHILDNVQGVSDENMAAYRAELEKYKNSFKDLVLTGGGKKARKTRRNHKGGANGRVTIGPATLAECALPGGGRQTRRHRNKNSGSKTRVRR